jgi:hypothetical protein
LGSMLPVGLPPTSSRRERSLSARGGAFEI